jgi:hypothetical protein
MTSRCTTPTGRFSEALRGVEEPAMAMVFDHAITEARRTIGRHQPWRRWIRNRCTAGCGRWPCKPFFAALAVITRNSNTSMMR